MSAPHLWLAALAQLVEHRIRNAEVGCSSHLRGTIFCNNFNNLDERPFQIRSLNLY